MKKPIDGEQHYFVDEAGDPVFYDQRGNLIVGQEGCASILLLGFVETGDPSSIRRALADLHAEIAVDRYLQQIPSIHRTNRSFHAKDDAAEVRYLVYKRLAELELKAQFVVARKRERTFRNSFHARESEFYDYLISRLFENVLHRHTHSRICFSRRGSRIRQAQLEEALRRGIGQFAERWKTKVDTEIEVKSQTGVGEPCLQVVDYMNWAVQRAFVKREMRYYRFVEEKVSLLFDLYDTAHYPGNYYGRDRPFDIENASPL